MKRTVFLIICSLNFIYSCSEKSKDKYSRLFIDDRHDQFRKAGDTSVAPYYQITSLKGIVLDCSRYNFSNIKQINYGKDPDVVLVHSNAGTFLVKLNLAGETIIDSSSMMAIDSASTTAFDQNKKTFIGFIKGDTAKIGIGIAGLNNGIVQMTAFWAAKIEIQ